MTISDPRTKRRLIASAPAATCALIATFLMLDTTQGDSDLRTTIVVSLAAAWLALVATVIFASAHRWSLWRDLGAQLVAGSLAAAAPWAPAEVGVFAPTYFAALAFASLAAPLGRLTDAETYWPWVEKLCFAAALATLGAIVGFSAILATTLSAATLFGLSKLTFGAIAPKVAIVMFVAVLPIAFLALQPPVEETPLDRRATDFLRRAAAALECYALAPFVLVYSALLWAYAGKIVLERMLPMGQVGVMVGAFGFTAMLTILLIFPERRRGPFVVRWLWRIWPFLLPAPLVLLGFAIAERVETYGMTPDRYVASMLAVLCAAAGLAALGDRDRVIRFAPAATTLALLLASLGPFGAIATSVRWQSAVVGSILSAHGLLGPDGRLVEEGAPVALSEVETRRWRAAIELLKEFERTPPVFGRQAPKANEALERLDARVIAAKPSEGSSIARSRWRIFQSKSWAGSADDALDDLSILGVVALSDPSSKAEMLLDGSHLSIAPLGHGAATFDLADLAHRLDERKSDLSRPQIVEASTADGGVYRLLVLQLTSSFDTRGPKIESITALILKTGAPPPRASAHSR